MASTDDGETSPFLASHEDGPDGKGFHRNEKRLATSRILKIHSTLFVIQIVFLVLNLAFFTWNATSSGTRINNDVGETALDEPFSPLQSVIQYSVEGVQTHPSPSPFSGSPRLEVDEAWSHLLRSSMIKLSADEMRKMNKTSIVLRDGGGYVGYLESIHMLHCVKRIYQSQHPEHYPELQGTDAFTPAHWDHCLEVLRQGIMCNADTAINTYTWGTPYEIKGNRDWPRKCTNWDRVAAWADERRVTFEGAEKFLASLVQSDEPGSLGPMY